MKSLTLGGALAAKRAVDVTVCVASLAVLAPLYLVISILIAVNMRRPIIYRQTRLGLHGRPFYLYKFRTMRAPVVGENELLSDRDRVTRLGQFLRDTSLDELPGLVNVVLGHMSLVGPRPALPIYMDLDLDHKLLRKRLEMRPGVTGLAQVSGRQDLSFMKRIQLDASYVDNWGLGLDLRILLRTVPRVVARKGARTGQRIADVDDVGLENALRRSTRE